MELLRRAREGMDLLPLVLRRPRAIWRWVAGAYVAQIGALVLVPGLWFGLPLLLEPAFDVLYPPVVEREKILGIIPHHVRRDDPRRERREAQAAALAWLTALGGLALLLLAHLPRACADAAEDVSADDLAATLLEHDPRLAPAPPTSRSLDVVAGRYRLKGELGRGGMGVVHRAVDEVLGREVALKELPHGFAGDEEVARRFRQEARLLARLSHPHVVTVHDLVEEAGRLWIAMELVEGGDLADLLDARERLPVEEALPLALGIAEGVEHAHAQGIIHRDIKPMNVLLTRGGVPKVTDFGLARLAASAVHTQDGALLGSPRYMSPEQAAGRASDPRTDVYSFGILLYEMLVGRAPFEGEMRSVIAQQISQPPTPLRALVPDLPEEVERAVLAMLAKEPEARPHDFSSLVALLRCLARLSAR